MHANSWGLSGSVGASFGHVAAAGARISSGAIIGGQLREARRSDVAPLPPKRAVAAAIARRPVWLARCPASDDV